MNNQWNDKVFTVTDSNFQQVALEIFRFQYRHNKIYKDFVDTLKFKPQNVAHLSQIPFLPIQFFKTHPVMTTEFAPAVVFESSGTTQNLNSHHYVKDTSLYKSSFLKTFELFYGSLDELCIIALLPSYLERTNSSLIFMVDEWIRRSNHPVSGFYLYEHEKLFEKLKELESSGQKTIFIGVSFALLDFAEKYSLPLRNTIVMETGGMKGRRQEIVRDDLHEILKQRFHVDAIHSEYGMTELLSQAYSLSAGIFQTPPWMKVLIRDEEDPLTVQPAVSTNDYGLKPKDSPSTAGAINIIDLANIYSCSFIATDDAGKLYADGTFEVLGRIDNSDIRGCSLLMV